MYSVIQVFYLLIGLLPICSIQYLKWGIEASIIVELFISPLNSVSLCFMYFGAALLHAYVYNCYKTLLD